MTAMSNRVVLILFIACVLLVGGFLWTIAITFGPMDKPAAQPAAASATGKPSSATPTGLSGVTTVIDSPAEKLKRARTYLEPPLTRGSIDAAKLILKNIPA